MRQKCTAADIWGIIYPALMYMGIAYVVQFAAVIVVSFIIGFQHADAISQMGKLEIEEILNNSLNGSLLLLSALSGLVAIPFGALCMYFDTLKEKKLGIYKKYKVSIGSYLLIIPLSFTTMVMGNEIVSIIQAFLPKQWLAIYDNTAEVLYSGGIGVQILATVIAAPIIEEIIFRGLVYKRIKYVSNSIVAIILSSLAFGIFHWNVVQGIYAFIIGVVLAYIYEKYKSIIAPIIFHMTANLISVIMSNSVSPEELEQTQDIVYTQEYLVALSIVAVVMGVITFVLLYAVKRSVKPREIKCN